MPFITNCYLLKMSVFRTPAAKAVTYSKEDLDPDMAFCSSLRELVCVEFASFTTISGRPTNTLLNGPRLSTYIKEKSTDNTHTHNLFQKLITCT